VSYSFKISGVEDQLLVSHYCLCPLPSTMSSSSTISCPSTVSSPLYRVLLLYHVLPLYRVLPPLPYPPPCIVSSPHSWLKGVVGVWHLTHHPELDVTLTAERGATLFVHTSIRDVHMYTHQKQT